MMTNHISLVAQNLSDCMDLFLIDKRNLSVNTIRYYRCSLSGFLLFCTLTGAKKLDDLDANMIKRYLISLENQGYNAGGVYAKWRAVRAFLNWYAIKTGWSVPDIKVKVGG